MKKVRTAMKAGNAITDQIEERKWQCYEYCEREAFHE